MARSIAASQRRRRGVRKDAADARIRNGRPPARSHRFQDRAQVRPPILLVPRKILADSPPLSDRTIQRAVSSTLRPRSRDARGVDHIPVPRAPDPNADPTSSRTSRGFAASPSARSRSGRSPPSSPDTLPRHTRRWPVAIRLRRRRGTSPRHTRRRKDRAGRRLLASSHSIERLARRRRASQAGTCRGVGILIFPKKDASPLRTIPVRTVSTRPGVGCCRSRSARQ